MYAESTYVPQCEYGGLIYMYTIYKTSLWTPEMHAFLYISEPWLSPPLGALIRDMNTTIRCQQHL